LINCPWGGGLLRGGRRCGGGQSVVFISAISVLEWRQYRSHPTPPPDLTPFRITLHSDLLKRVFKSAPCFSLLERKLSLEKEVGEYCWAITGHGEVRPWSIGFQRVVVSISTGFHQYIHTYTHTYIRTYVRTYIHSFIKAKFNLEQATKNQRESRGLDLLFL